MDKLTAADRFGLISFVVAILSLALNLAQWRKDREHRRDIVQRTVAGMNAGYQALWRIAEICDGIRAITKEADHGESLLPVVLASVQEITGNADTGRTTMNSICRDLVGVRLVYEPSWKAQQIVLEGSEDGKFLPA
ncbi:MAG TPA: hypothetical protein VGG06_09915 [Thermoanaerobaculia bacterium]|jgi:hypothetical protein